MQPTVDELLAAMREGTIKAHKCGECNGTGTKYNGSGKPSTCPRCKGKRKVVRIPRADYELPYSTGWQHYLGDK
jgi:DnaJ-class molecular chaperone